MDWMPGNEILSLLDGVPYFPRGGGGVGGWLCGVCVVVLLCGLVVFLCVVGGVCGCWCWVGFWCVCGGGVGGRGDRV